MPCEFCKKTPPSSSKRFFNARKVKSGPLPSQEAPLLNPLTRGLGGTITQAPRFNCGKLAKPAPLHLNQSRARAALFAIARDCGESEAPANNISLVNLSGDARTS